MRCKRGAVVFAVCLMMMLCSGRAIADAGGTAAKGPNAVVEGADYNFGSVPAGKDVLHDFVIKNTGDTTLDITSVKTS